MLRLTNTNMRKYYIEFGGSMIAYAVVLTLVVSSRPPTTEHEGTARLLELLPIIPLLCVLWAIIRQFRRMDEYYQRIQAEAFALGALIGGVIVLSWGFAENAGAPKLSTIFIAPGLIALWGLCLPIISRRYK